MNANDNLEQKRENSIIRFGRAMKQVKGLWFLGFGLFLFIVWECLYWWLYFGLLSPGATADNPFQIFLLSLEIAVDIALHPTITVFSLYPITMFALIAIGLFRLVWSSFHTWSDEEQE